MAVLHLAIIGFLFNTVQGTGMVELSFVYFESIEAHCCDTVGMLCLSQCDPYFDICLDDINSDDPSTDMCVLGRHTTEAVHNRDFIEFDKEETELTTPVYFPFVKWTEGGLWYKVDIWDHDAINDDFIEHLNKRIEVTPSQSASYAQSIPIRIGGDIAQLAVVLRVYCNDHWYTDDCSVYCNADTSNEYTHYDCGDNGQYICHPGWVGESCSININECASIPCQNRGLCLDGVNEYSCICLEGYSGVHCEILTDICVTEPCLNGGQCDSDGVEYNCTCAVGFTGINCETEIDYCEGNPCENGATCYNYGGQFWCDCDVGYTGETCSEEALGNGQVLIKLLSYDNPEGQGDNGNCCDGYSFCHSACDPYFDICIDRPDGDQTMESCAVGRQVTGTIQNSNDIVFDDAIGGTANPISFPFSQWYPDGILVKIDIWDEDSPGQDDFVEYYMENVGILPAPSADKASWLRVTLTGRTQLVIEIQAYCEPEWYGPACSVSCIHRDEEGGHYQCHLSNGVKKCIKGWIGVNCNVSMEGELAMSEYPSH